MRVTWFGHSSVKIEVGSQIVYIDPYAGPDQWYVPGSIILVSEWHFDHCNVSKLRRASNDGTHVLGTVEVARNVFPCSAIRAGESRVFDGVEIFCMPVRHSRVDLRGHVHSVESVGFVVIGEGKKVYFMGDSDFLSQTERMVPDILLISVGGTYTSGPREAARTASLISPKLAVPVHWGSTAGTRDDALLFSELAQCAVKILEPGQSIEV